MNDDDEEDFLDHYDDDPFHDIPPLGVTDEEMLAMADDEDFRGIILVRRDGGVKSI
ncbi:MAG: phosphonate ABC transporter substrate-binding protein, partial [Acidimicrobiia bacterium]|nr:phosphonate ABC transporter substrate-binding protein [Acidimicrobiia bacterium]